MFNGMFDELKEVKHFKEITDFKGLINKTFKESSKSKQRGYLELKRASTMELFCEHT